MTITRHPPEDLLASFAAGRLDEAEHLAVAVHVAGCARCGRFVHAIERISGAALEETAPAPMAIGAFDSVMMRIDQVPATLPGKPPRSVPADRQLPEPLRRYEIGKRRRVAPGVGLRPIKLSGSGKSRAFLLESAPGTRMIQHSHSGIELTCVLKGSFSHEGGYYGPGDFDYGDDDVDHRPIVGSEGPCLCLVAMTGDLRMSGFFGRILSPFIRL